MSSASEPSPQYEPEGHNEHATVAAGENSPAAHGAHVVAPSASRVFVMEPAAHGAHAEVDVAEYSPGIHGVHADAPALARVSVTEPAEHGVGDVKRAVQKLPAGHATWVAGVSQ